ncbi:MAG TPA: ribonucleotide-diphosphate reductase subunit beta, partial [Tissierellaceae bacterium]|nr:ribonucleotide-diphosphate reductase subunit beta [Tissierellaceae bacterium]
MPKPEIASVGATFSDSEVRHGDAYSHLLELLGLQDEFTKLMEIPCMKERIKYLSAANEKSNSHDPKEYFESLILFSMMVENVSLFSQFFIIMSYNKYGNMLTGMSNVIEATSKEEACFIEGTEILTPEGWVDLRQAHTGMRVYQYNKDGSIEPVTATHATHKPYKGTMYSFSKRGRQAVVTEDHRITYTNHKGEWKEKLAKDFKGDTKKYIPESGTIFWKGRGMSPWERLLVAFQADGFPSYWTNKEGDRLYRGAAGGKNAVISVKKQRKKDRLEFLLIDCGIDFTTIESKPGYTDYKFYIKDAHKYKDFSWINLDDVGSKWANDFVEELSLWDGSLVEEGVDRKLLYSSTNKSCVDIAQAIGTLAGYRCHISK